MRWLKFLRLIPEYYRMYRDGEDPATVRKVFENYSRVLWMNTGGRLSKLSYTPEFVTEEIALYYYEDDNK